MDLRMAKGIRYAAVSAIFAMLLTCHAAHARTTSALQRVEAEETKTIEADNQLQTAQTAHGEQDEKEAEPKEVSAEEREGAQKEIQKEEPREEEKWADFVATFYAPPKGARTSTGKIPTLDTIAVDPRVIPMGSRVEIEYPDGTRETRTAEDTGGAIRGNIVDVFCESRKEAFRKGRQTVKIRIMEE